MDIGEWVTPMSPVVKVVVDSLLGQLPVIGVFVVGMVIGLVYMKRYPGPAFLTILAFGLLLLTLISHTIGSNYLFVEARTKWALTDLQVAGVAKAMSIGFNLLRAVAYALLLTAIFGGRSKADSMAQQSENR